MIFLVWKRLLLKCLQAVSERWKVAIFVSYNAEHVLWSLSVNTSRLITHIIIIVLDLLCVICMKWLTRFLLVMKRWDSVYLCCGRGNLHFCGKCIWDTLIRAKYIVPTQSLWPSLPSILTLISRLLTFNVDPDCQGYIVFSNSTEQSREVNKPINSMSDNNFLQILEIQNVRENEWTWKLCFIEKWRVLNYAGNGSII